MDDFLDKFLSWVVGVGLVIGFVVLMAAGYNSVQYQENVTMPAAYEAWSKHTGNPGKLTYQEWRHLRSSGILDDDE